MKLTILWQTYTYASGTVIFLVLLMCILITFGWLHTETIPHFHWLDFAQEMKYLFYRHFSFLHIITWHCWTYTHICSRWMFYLHSTTNILSFTFIFFLINYLFFSFISIIEMHFSYREMHKPWLSGLMCSDKCQQLSNLHLYPDIECFHHPSTFPDAASQ